MQCSPSQDHRDELFQESARKILQTAVDQYQKYDKSHQTNTNYWFLNLLSNRYITNPSAFTAGKWKGNIQSL